MKGNAVNRGERRMSVTFPAQALPSSGSTGLSQPQHTLGHPGKPAPLQRGICNRHKFKEEIF